MAGTLQFRLTTNNLGGAATTTQLSDTALNNLYDNVSSDEAASGDTEYRALDIYNSGDATATSVSCFCTGTPSTGTDILFALETSPTNSITSITTESDAPSISGSFTAYTSESKLNLPDIEVDSYIRLWIARTVAASTSNSASDGTTLSVEYA